MSILKAERPSSAQLHHQWARQPSSRCKAVPSQLWLCSHCLTSSSLFRFSSCKGQLALQRPHGGSSQLLFPHGSHGVMGILTVNPGFHATWQPWVMGILTVNPGFHAYLGSEEEQGELFLLRSHHRGTDFQWCSLKNKGNLISKNSSTDEEKEKEVPCWWPRTLNELCDSSSLQKSILFSSY